MLSDEQIERYSRQIILPQVGGKGQESLLRARVLVHGNDVLIMTALYYLAAAGIGTLGVIAPVCRGARDSSSLLDQFSELPRLNPDCSILLHPEEDISSPQRLVQNYDLTLSTSDLLHDICWEAKRPFLYALLTDEEAWLMYCRGYEGDFPCLRCTSLSLVPQQTSSPLLGIVAAFLGAQLATEAIKDLLHLPRKERGLLLRFQIPLFQCTEEEMKKSPTCPTCHTVP